MSTTKNLPLTLTDEQRTFWDAWFALQKHVRFVTRIDGARSQVSVLLDLTGHVPPGVPTVEGQAHSASPGDALALAAMKAAVSLLRWLHEAEQRIVSSRLGIDHLMAMTHREGMDAQTLALEILSYYPITALEIVGGRLYLQSARPEPTTVEDPFQNVRKWLNERHYAAMSAEQNTLTYVRRETTPFLAIIEGMVPPLRARMLALLPDDERPTTFLPKQA